VNTVDESPAPPGSTPPGRWFQRVLPVTGILLLLVAVLAALVPQFRSELRLSVTREPERYVDLYFIEAASGSLEGGQTTCTRDRSDIAVDFVVRSHLGATARIPYSITVKPARKGLKPRRAHGAVRLSPGSSKTLHETLALPARTAYVVTVSLPGRQQHLRAHCGKGRSA
jgi:hypothetical protein